MNENLLGARVTVSRALLPRDRPLAVGRSHQTDIIRSQRVAIASLLLR